MIVLTPPCGYIMFHCPEVVKPYSFYSTTCAQHANTALLTAWPFLIVMLVLRITVVLNGNRLQRSCHK